MKRVLFFIVSAFMAATSSFASATESVSSLINSDNTVSIVKKLKENSGTSLVLEKASDLVAKVKAHYSHSSHSSHSSHRSHSSHYSSR